MQVAQQLHLDVAHLLQEFLQEHRRGAEGALRLGARGGERRLQVLLLAHDAHAAAATAVRRLHQDGASVLCEEGARLVQHPGVVAFQGDAGHHRHAHLLGQLLRGDLVTHGPHHGRARADEADASALACLGEVGVLRQEAIARVDGVHAGLLGHVEDFVDAQVRLHGTLAAPDEVGLVRLVAVLVGAVLVAVDGDGADAQLVACPEDADGDFTAVGAQHLLDRSQGRDGHIPPAVATPESRVQSIRGGTSALRRSTHTPVPEGERSLARNRTQGPLCHQNPLRSPMGPGARSSKTGG
jgi:hypothetical protein